MKRSSQVALLLMGAAGIGAASYALMRGNDCAPAPGSAVSGAQSGQDCSSRRSSGSGGHGGSWSSYRSGGGTGSSSGSGGGESSAAHGGFGSTGAAHASGS
jgi:hypothetical protein